MEKQREYEATVEVDGQKATFHFTERRRPQWIPGQWVDGHKRADGSWSTGYRTRGYMSCSQTDFTKKPRMYVDVKGESLLDNLANRTTRPSAVWGRAIRKAMKAAGFTGHIGWSQKAGCSCPCSPGFIWTDAPLIGFGGTHAHRNYDVWVELEDAPTVRTDDDARFTQLTRVAAIGGDPTLPLDVLANTRL